jgi:DnaJ-class molecular chaperone
MANKLTEDERAQILAHYTLSLCPGCAGEGNGLDPTTNCRACNGRGELVEGAPDFIPTKLPKEIGPACPGCGLADLWTDCDCEPVASGRAA